MRLSATLYLYLANQPCATRRLKYVLCYHCLKHVSTSLTSDPNLSPQILKPSPFLTPAPLSPCPLPLEQVGDPAMMADWDSCTKNPADHARYVAKASFLEVRREAAKAELLTRAGSSNLVAVPPKKKRKALPSELQPGQPSTHSAGGIPLMPVVEKKGRRRGKGVVATQPMQPPSGIGALLMQLRQPPGAGFPGSLGAGGGPQHMQLPLGSLGAGGGPQHMQHPLASLGAGGGPQHMQHPLGGLGAGGGPQHMQHPLASLGAGGGPQHMQLPPGGLGAGVPQHLQLPLASLGAGVLVGSPSGFGVGSPSGLGSSLGSPSGLGSPGLSRLLMPSPSKEQLSLLLDFFN
jgi:hypothetical protein